MTQNTLQTQFGELRRWLETAHIDQYWMMAFLPFLKEAHDTNPEVYKEQWLPYLEARTDLWQQVVLDVVYREGITIYNSASKRRYETTLQNLRQFAPFVHHFYDVSDFIEPDYLYEELAEEMDGMSFDFGWDDLIPVSFTRSKQASSLRYVVDCEEGAQFGNPQSGYWTVSHDEIPTRLLERLVWRGHANLEHIQINDPDTEEINPTEVFDAIKAGKLPALKHVQLDDWRTASNEDIAHIFQHDALRQLSWLSLPSGAFDAALYETACFDNIEGLSFNTLTTEQALALTRNKTLTNLKALMLTEADHIAVEVHEQLTQNPQFKTLQTIQLGSSQEDSASHIEPWLRSTNHQHIKHLYLNTSEFSELEDEDGINFREHMKPRANFVRPNWMTKQPSLHLLGQHPTAIFEALQRMAPTYALEGLYIEGLTTAELEFLSTFPWFKQLHHFGVDRYGISLQGIADLVEQLVQHPKNWETLLLNTGNAMLPEVFKHLFEQPNTQHLKYLSIHHNTPQELEQIAQHCPNLTYLELRTLTVDCAHVIVSEFKHLKGLNIWWFANLSEETVKVLGQSPAIQEAMRAARSGRWCDYP